jgi:lipoate-protein ligase A
MYFWNFSSDSAAKNLAYDEALLEVIEASDGPVEEVLRVWEMPTYCVVLGRSSVAAQESISANCEKMNIPVLRRCSGGATILAGSGCLMYSVVLSLEDRPELSMIDGAHDFVMDRLLAATDECGITAQRKGICDLVFEHKKFSGNAMRLKRRSLLYHGTILYSMDIRLVDSLLGKPAREPEYRDGRSHGEFVGNVPISKGTLIRTLRTAFDANEDWSDFPQRQLLEIKANQMLQQRYSLSEWNFAR